MYPVLFSFMGITVHSYGVLLFLGVVAGIITGKILSRRVGLEWPAIHRIALYSAFVGLLGAKVFGLLELRSWPQSLADLWGAFLAAGFVFYGAPLTALPFAAWSLTRRKLPVLLCLDMAATGFAIGGSLGRLGCFLGGCCYGIPTSSVFAVEHNHVLCHPTQLYESLGMAFLFLMLLVRFSRRRFDGESLVVFLLSYATLRTAIEIFRGDLDRGFVLGILSTSQAISLVVVFGTILALFLAKRSGSLALRPIPAL